MRNLKARGQLAFSIGLQIARGRQWAFSFNVADRCPINCDCYWRAQARVEEMDDDEVRRFFSLMKAGRYQHVTLIGGEPYVRRHLLSQIAGIIPATWLITSGTSPLLHLDRTTHIISIDGKDSETHDGIRKSQGLFGRILKNLGAARQAWRGSFPAVGHCVLNARNYRQIAEILRYWKDNQLLDGILFSAATPIQGANDEHLKLSPDERFWYYRAAWTT
jgi:MoaA/NifB/PqqE/SkfB family radical SAM enzyme